MEMKLFGAGQLPPWGLAQARAVEDPLVPLNGNKPSLARLELTAASAPPSDRHGLAQAGGGDVSVGVGVVVGVGVGDAVFVFVLVAVGVDVALRLADRLALVEVVREGVGVAVFEARTDELSVGVGEVDGTDTVGDGSGLAPSVKLVIRFGLARFELGALLRSSTNPRMATMVAATSAIASKPQNPRCRAPVSSSS